MPHVQRFEGVTGRVAAKVMARHNRDAEREALEELDPSPGDTVVAIGIGPGVGVEMLARRVRRVLGVDPSGAMVDEARRRNRGSIVAGAVEIVRTDAAHLPLPAGEADGAIAVNSIQLWEPLDESLAEVARVLRPGGSLVALTHDWAIERNSGHAPDAWAAVVGRDCARVGLIDPRCWRGRAEDGRSVGFAVTRAPGSGAQDRRCP